MRHNINLPVEPSDLTKLNIKDIVYLDGLIITARDQAHKRIIDSYEKKGGVPEFFEIIKGCAIYHCGPIIKECNDDYEVISAGPTTSQRMDRLENQVVKLLDIRFIIGKGGMRNLKTKANKVVYLSFTGGCGAIVNKFVKHVENVEWLDLGKCESVWFLKVKNFGPLIVAQDVHGKVIYNFQS
ncbi:MAG: fumarate hydratase [Candidatus Lokiarchaeota archaeon]|nr:fumarate hydratase [Candidatus Lokiarchaeota archaeon]